MLVIVKVGAQTETTLTSAAVTESGGPVAIALKLVEQSETVQQHLRQINAPPTDQPKSVLVHQAAPTLYPTPPPVFRQDAVQALVTQLIIINKCLAQTPVVLHT